MKAEIAGQAVKFVAAIGSITTFAWWSANSSAITAICAFVTTVFVIITAMINWRFKHKN